MTAWMRLYGEANDVPGLATGPIETRFARLRENTAADTLVVWTTPTRWAAGEGLSLRFPQLHLEFGCTLSDGHLIANKVAQVTEDARPPDREPGAVGVVVHPERVPLPPEDQPVTDTDVGVEMLERHFAQLAGKRWSGFAAPLRAALEAEAEEDEARTQRLTVPFQDGALSHGGEEDVWRLKGIAVEALRQLDDGEWLEILDDQGRSRTSARVIDTHPGAGTLVVGVRTASDPPHSGYVRPRSRRKILEQKRALLDELASPTGSLPNLVRLVAAPASMPTPRQVRPERFVNSAVARNRSQARAVSLALGLEDGEALLIQGPPGTGKSTTAAEIDIQLILRDPGVRILVCSHSNHGTDNMLMKVLPFLDDAADRIARIGFYERIAREARPFYAAADADLGDRNVIFTTIDALVLQDIAGARVYDYVILDEANRAGVLDSLLALARGKRMILVGDPMQLQPVMSEAEQQIVAASNQQNGTGARHGRHAGRNQLVGVAQPGANNVIGKSLFAWIQERHFAPGAAVLLDQQNRMHPAIGELVSRVFYSNRVRTGPAAPRRGTGLPAFPSPVTWVDTRSLRGNVESRAGGTSLFNVAEARLVTSITRNLASQAPPNLTIGVITAYAEQRDLLRRLMGPHDWPPDRALEIDTVDAFEGREKDIIVLSLVRANRRRDIGFLRLEQRLNVAISRSRRLLIIVGDTSTLRQGYFHHLVATCQQVGQIIPAPKLIGMFLSRGRRRQEREEHRREVAAEEAAASADGEVVTTEAGVTVEGGVAPVSTAGQESHGAGAGGSRRRRRRAWERRRERLRAMHEQAASAEDVAPSDESVDSVAPEVPSAPSEEEDVTGPVVRPRRPRRRREPSVALEVAAETEAEPEVEPEPEPVKPRRTRTRKVAEPVTQLELLTESEPAEVTPPTPRRRTRAKALPPVEPVVNEEIVEVKPVRRARAKKIEVVEPPIAEIVEAKPVRRTRSKKAEVPAVAEVVEVVEAKPARRARAKKAEVAEPVVVEVIEVVETKPARRTRTKKTAVEAVEVDLEAEAPVLNGTSAEPVPAVRPRARRATRAS
ncbi:MAG: AAA family ATPase [Chloroflexi bacterium]|nr:AAA family ATPase [Chloroflexota bacterium]